ncbi:uncharacterized protein B0I36DRAFT_373282 [Microdochium trichocladiopsis]|uniref:Uncharacterized protein n=1 Tax=Microdochium trichocladiopsis TaxID=1682393 RepID=A0A9P9BTK1_9PEZI|nr:uncharacterized protein B0I36DRAFT_373282 [Microdochium trichocladiopsis]KAH7036045.1 hypothetical protein B0I36DRAFT_373282 [Microdochium trichocladiopsis]
MHEFNAEVPANANVGWQDLSSNQGEKYRVKAENYDLADEASNGDAVAASGPQFKNVQVRWEVGTQGAPIKEVQEKTSITYYKLSKAPWWSPFKYELTITAKDTYDFRFTDEEPDTYKIDVYQNAGSHYVQYDSPRPTIVSISGF